MGCSADVDVDGGPFPAAILGSPPCGGCAVTLQKVRELLVGPLKGPVSSADSGHAATAGRTVLAGIIVRIVAAQRWRWQGGDDRRCQHPTRQSTRHRMPPFCGVRQGTPPRRRHPKIIRLRRSGIAACRMSRQPMVSKAGPGLFAETPTKRLRRLAPGEPDRACTPLVVPSPHGAGSPHSE